MDMSLDDIIKMKKISTRPGKPNVKRLNVNKNNFANKPILRKNLVDARNKIIQRNRSKIRDARERLSQTNMDGVDARLRLRYKKLDMNKGFQLHTSNFREKPRPKKRLPFRSAKFIGAPLGYIDHDNMETVEEEYNSIGLSLRRTVHNDVIPLPSFSMYNKPEKKNRLGAPSWKSDPFNVYEIPTINLTSEKDDSDMYNYPRKHSHVPESSHLSYEMRSRLENAPDVHASVGIFANPLKPTVPTTTYRIVVSNLHSSVTQSDIKELFEDIGELVDSRLVRPGVAEVVFRNLKDAEKAVDTYHNRQLDGQPMKCLLVNPRSWNKPTAPAVKTKSSSRSKDKTPLEIDIDALHKVLFRRH